MREFYIKITKRFGWTKDVLIHNIDSDAYEKFLANQTNFYKTVAKKYKHQAKLAVKDEYSFGFLEMSEEHSENPSIGIIVCRNKNRLKVEYALKSSNAPIGVATYTLHENLPDEMKKLLPSPEEIAKIIKELD